MALLLLRVVVGAVATHEAALIVASGHTVPAGATVAAITTGAAGVALIIGILTPLASALICIWSLAITLLGATHTAFLLIDSRMVAFELFVMAAVLMILGPGAMSLDARFFGRREVAIREVRRPNDF
jgi:uncharacterized membrane protein YphA (DoxX/SURF4 family)